MKIFTEKESIRFIKSPVLTIGTFDGVHLGHQKIIDRLNKEAIESGGESVLFTFHPHPRIILYPDSHGLKLIQTQEEKMNCLQSCGLQNVVVFPFTFEFSRMSALEFVRDLLVNTLHVKKLVIGYDHQFGKNREGTLSYLHEISETYDFEVIEIPAEEIDSVNVSSTKIRQALADGNVELTADYLGRPFELSGIVVKGQQLGRTIGYPTANLLLEDSTKIIPKTGVYAVRAYIDSTCYMGMMNIGNRPTVSEGGMQSIEVHILDFDSDLYGKELRIEFIHRVRDEQKFDSVEYLQNQLKLDEITVRSFSDILA